MRQRLNLQHRDASTLSVDVKGNFVRLGRRVGPKRRAEVTASSHHSPSDSLMPVVINIRSMPARHATTCLWIVRGWTRGYSSSND